MTTANPPTAQKAMRILIADDEPRILHEYAQILGASEAHGGERDALAVLEAELFGGSRSAPAEHYELCLCRQSEDAIGAVRESIRDGRPFAVAFLDFRMPPGADGVVTAERIRALDPDINIVFVTAYSDVGLEEIATRVPPPDKILYCHKPLHAIELRQFAHALTAKWATERHLHATQTRIQQIINSTPVVVYCCEPAPSYRPTFVSNSLQKLFGHDERSFLEDPKAWLSHVHPDDRDRVLREAENLPSVGEMSTEYRFECRDGSFRWICDRVKLLRDGMGRPTELVGCLIDITQQREAEDRIRALAYYDGLTGLPNRTLMRELLDRELAAAVRYERRLAILFLDLDQFKRINDNLGHDKGDRLLAEVAKRLLGCIRRSDGIFQEGSCEAKGPFETVSRLGGDEFVIILSEITSAEDAAQVARRIALALAEPIALSDDAPIAPSAEPVSVTASIGISIFPHDATDVETLLKHADTAMYHAKEQGRNCYQFFGKSMNEKAARRYSIESNLRGAIERNELRLFYQPRIDIKRRRLVGMEALLRWNMPDGSSVLPAEFVPVAEENGLILPIGEWVFYEACRQTEEWSRAGLRDLTVSINLSAVQFKKKGLVNLISDVLSTSGLPPSHLELELTESLLVNDKLLSQGLMTELKTSGVKTSLDDFGTGYSSLSYIKHFPFDALKLDQSLIQDLTHGVKDVAIVKATIALAHSLGMLIVAEGVERQSQLDFLVAHECDEAQGYLFTPPLDAAQFERWVRTSSLAEGMEGAMAPSDPAIQTSSVSKVTQMGRVILDTTHKPRYISR
jgi:diguanylate cyclase (GGDEF)-like protein/PAS domain S-box-containing protein